MTWPHSLLYWYAVQELTYKICYLSDYFLLKKLIWNLREQSWVGLDGLWGINIKGENWNIVSGLSTKINVVTKKSIRKLTFYKYSVIICLSADYIMMVKNLSMDQFFWINSHVNSLLELTFTLTRLFWHLLTLTCSICAMLAEWSE